MSRMSPRIGRIGSVALGPLGTIASAGMVAVLAGCASVPSAPSSAAAVQPSTPPAAASSVMPTSATAPAGAPPSYAVAAPIPSVAAPSDSGPLLVAPANAAGTGAAAAPASMPPVDASASGYPPGAAPPAVASTPGPAATTTPTAASPPAAASTSAADKSKPADENSGFEWSDLAPDVMWKNLMKSMGYGPDRPIADAQFREAEELFRAKKYAEAAPKFYIASWRWPDSTLEEDALFLEGECYYFDDQYGKAEDAYDELLKTHGNTRYLDTVMWRLYALAVYWEKLDAVEPHWPVTPNFNDKTRPRFDSWGNAIGAYESIHLHDPRGPLADSAVMAIANMNFRAGRYEEAAHYYDIIRKDYAKSKYQLQAHLLGLQSKMRMYQGPLYDGQPLKDATEIADQTLRQFRGRLGDEQARVLETRAQIVVLKAEREWVLGQYYDRKQYYAAARQYYQYLIENYPRTPYAEQARTRLEQIRHEPDSPPDRFKVLREIFDHER
jgi:outer membrane protein assembly factor BamD (BamD/ComL family)